MARAIWSLIQKHLFFGFFDHLKSFALVLWVGLVDFLQGHVDLSLCFVWSFVEVPGHVHHLWSSGSAVCFQGGFVGMY